MKKIIVLFLSLALIPALCACASGPAAPAPTEAPTAVPTEAPAPQPAAEPSGEAGFTFSTTDRDGNAWTEASLAGYSLVMINFWEPWCGPCVGEMPELQRLSETYADRGFLLLGVYATEGMEEDVEAVLSSTGVTYPILHYCDAFDVFQSGYVPTTVFLDGEGHVLSADGETLTVGSRSYEDWAALVEKLL